VPDVSATWSSWSGRVRCAPRELLAPADEAEIVRAVRRAGGAGLEVRVAGSGHSFSPVVATGGLLLSLEQWQGIESFDSSSLRATIRAGTRLSALGGPLAARGAALANQGDVDVQALGGAIGTGTHGTGRTLGSLSTQVVGMRLVTAAGEIEDWSRETSPERVDAAAVSLGMLGVATAIALQLVPAYRLHERIWKTGIEECLADLEAHVAGHRHYEFFWYPHRDYAEHKTLDPTAAAPDPLPERKGERIDWSHRIFPTLRDLRFNEMEYAVPAASGAACFRAVRERMRRRHADVVWPVEYRTVAADGLWLSPAHGRDTVTISLHQAAELPCDAFFADCEPIFVEHGGRPHWGKVHTRRAGDLAALYPRWGDFVALRRELDPHGVFLNDHLRSLLASG
jgi:FAD/FMN-containing dehydrogenase